MTGRIFAALILSTWVGVAVRYFLPKAKAQQSSISAPEQGMSIYLGFRNQVLTGSSAKMGQPPVIGPTHPWAVVMDMPIGANEATIAAFADGTASIYLSTGGGYIGGSQKYSAIREAGLKMLTTARELQSKMHVTQQFPLPKEGEISFYVVTDRGVYTAHASDVNCRKQVDPFTDLFAAGQEVMTQYRLNFKD